MDMMNSRLCQLIIHIRWWNFCRALKRIFLCPLPDPYSSIFPTRQLPPIPPRFTLPGAEVKLQNADLWSEFHQIGTEMIITKCGRWVFAYFYLKCRQNETESACDKMDLWVCNLMHSFFVLLLFYNKIFLQTPHTSKSKQKLFEYKKGRKKVLSLSRNGAQKFTAF